MSDNEAGVILLRFRCGNVCVGFELLQFLQGIDIAESEVVFERYRHAMDTGKPALHFAAVLVQVMAERWQQIFFEQTKYRMALLLRALTGDSKGRIGLLLFQCSHQALHQISGQQGRVARYGSQIFGAAVGETAMQTGKRAGKASQQIRPEWQAKCGIVVGVAIGINCQYLHLWRQTCNAVCYQGFAEEGLQAFVAVFHATALAAGQYQSSNLLDRYCHVSHRYTTFQPCARVRRWNPPGLDCAVPNNGHRARARCRQWRWKFQHRCDRCAVDGASRAP